MKRRLVLVIVAAIAASGLCATTTTSTAVAAPPIVVETFLDNTPGVAANCADGDTTNCTLRDAVLKAQQDAGADVVHLPQGTYTLTQNAPNCRVPHISASDLTILGLGTGATITTDASCTAGRVIEQQVSSLDMTLVLGNLTITGGRNAPAPGGGGVYSAAKIEMDHVTVTGNTTNGASAVGGGVFAAFGGLIENSTITNNKTLGTSSSGGGIAGGAMTISSSTISGNEIVGAAGDGGGVYANVSLQVLEATITGNTSTQNGGGVLAGGGSITAGTITDNTSVGGGGGISINANSSFSISDSTVSSNHSTGGAAAGGGIVMGLGAGTGVLNITGTTIAHNTASTIVGGIYGGNNALTLTNSTVTDNNVGGTYTALTGVTKLVYSTYSNNGEHAVMGPNLESFGSVLSGHAAGNCLVNSVTTHGWNYDVGGTSCGFVGGTNGDVENGTDPMLAALTVNPTSPATMKPLPGSPLVDAVPLAHCHDDGAATINEDERQETRPSGTGCDIGAHEAAQGGVSGTVVGLPAPKGTGAVHGAPAVVQVRFCPTAIPNCTAAQGRVVATASAVNGTYSAQDLYGPYVAAAFYCKAAAPCVVGGAGAAKGPNVFVTVDENIVPGVNLAVGFRPDLQARTSASLALTGANEYSPAAPVRTRSAGVKRNKTVQFVVRLDNDGNLADTIRLKAATTGSAKLTVTYREGATLIPNIATGLGRTYTVAGGASKVITVTVRAAANSALLATKYVVLKATSTGGAGAPLADTVRLKAVRS